MGYDLPTDLKKSEALRIMMEALYIPGTTIMRDPLSFHHHGEQQQQEQLLEEQYYYYDHTTGTEYTQPMVESRGTPPRGEEWYVPRGRRFNAYGGR